MFKYVLQILYKIIFGNSYGHNNNVLALKAFTGVQIILLFCVITLVPSATVCIDS